MIVIMTPGMIGIAFFPWQSLCIFFLSLNHFGQKWWWWVFLSCSRFQKVDFTNLSLSSTMFSVAFSCFVLFFSSQISIASGSPLSLSSKTLEGWARQSCPQLPHLEAISPSEPGLQEGQVEPERPSSEPTAGGGQDDTVDAGAWCHMEGRHSQPSMC